MHSNAMGVTRFICEITADNGNKFRVFETGDQRYYMFCLLAPDGSDSGIHNPVRKTRLTREATRFIRSNYAKTRRRKLEKN